MTLKLGRFIVFFKNNLQFCCLRSQNRKLFEISARLNQRVKSQQEKLDKAPKRASVTFDALDSGRRLSVDETYQFCYEYLNILYF